MPVTGATTRNDYTASAGQTVFNYTFQILLATDIKVIKNGTLLTINNDYTVADAGEQDGGTITLTTGASSGDAIAIFLGMPIDRTTEYQEAGDFLASDVNGDFDKAYVALNQVQTDVSRTLHLQDQDPSVNMELPLASERANKYLAFNAAGYPVATSDASTGTSSTLTFKDFGAVGDGVTDDTQALQDAFDYATANRAVLAPTRGVFLVNAPIVVGDFSGIKGYTSNNQDASCVIKAGSSFTSTYTMTYYDPEVGGGSTPLTYNIASILISKAWVDGAQVGNPIYIGKILLDGDSRKGSRGEPIHGLMMQAWASYVECNTANTTGYGIFFNLQKSNGDFAGNHVGNHFKANRIYKSGITPAGDSSPLSYTLNNQTHYYGAFQAGSLEFSRDSAGNQSRGKATDAWITDFVQASTCTGTAIRVINGGGWSGTGIHLNGPGRHGIYVDGCLSSGWTNNYIDGWGAHIDDNEGNFYAFWFADIFGFEDDEANASLTCSDNRVRLRDIPNKTGNKLIGYGAKGTAASTARVIMNGNSYTARPDVTQDTVAISYPFNFSGIQQGGLNITLNGNDLDPDSYPQDTNLYLVNFGRYIQFSSQTGNSWQTVTAKPTRRGARGEIVYRKDAVDSEPTHYLNVSGIDHGYDWKALGAGRSGTTAERPTLDSNDVGFDYFDTTLQAPYWWTGSAWVYSGAENTTYDTVADLVATTSLTSGNVETKGYYDPGVGGASYKIMTLAAYGKTPDEKGAAFTLGNNYVAVLKHDGSVSDLQFGVKRDDTTDSGANLVALLAAAKDQGFEVLFTDGIAVTNTALTIDKALFSIRGSGKLMSYLRIGSTFPEGSALLTVNDCGRTNGTGTNEKPFYTGIEKSVEMVGFTLMGNGRVRRAHGLAFTGLNDDMLIDVECRDFKGIGMSLGNADVVKVNAGSFVGGTTYKIAFLGTDTAVDPDEQEANIQARWNEYLSTTDVTYRIGTEFVNPAGENGSELTGAIVATGYTSDTVRESTFENIQIKNCGNITGGYEDPAMQIGSNGSKQGDNNIWFPLLRLIYSRGSALKVIPNVSNRARKIRIGHLFLHANKQLPDPGTDPNGENWHSDRDLIIIGNQGAAEGSSEIASVSIDQVDLVGLEDGHKCFVVNTGSSLHVGGFTGNAPNDSYYFYFNGADTSSIRNYNRGGIRVGSPVKSTANLIKIDGMQDTHQVTVSGVAATTVPSGSKKFATLPSGQWVVGNFYVIRDLGTGGNDAWNTYLGTSGITYAVGDEFTATSNDQTPLTGAICGTSGFKEGVEYKILDLGTAGNAAWVTYTGVSKTYAVGDLFTATANDSTLLTGAIVKVPYYPSYVGDIKHINDDNVVIANIYKPQDAAAASLFPRTAFYKSRKTTYFQKLYLITNSALTANDTDYATIQFIKVNADGTFGGQFARIETKTSGSGGTGDWTAGQTIEIPFTEPRLDEGEGIAFQIFKTGNGVIVPHLGVVAELSPNLSLQGAVE